VTNDVHFLLNRRQQECGPKAVIMGIVNVTPDSFSDGHEFFEPGRAIDHGKNLLADGADIIDVGGVSTAPFRKPISVDEELRRVLPVILGLKKLGNVIISIDTSCALVANAALEMGASLINDQSAGLFDADMPSVMTKAHAVVIMHDGKAVTSGVESGETIIYDNVLKEIYSFFDKRILELAKANVFPKKIIVDPGIGFGKGLKDSLTIINNMHYFQDLGAASLIGLSRKSFLGQITGIAHPKDRDAATLGAEALALFGGANIIRTHNVKAARAMALVVDSCLKEQQGRGL
jgi:dihydropteroate synthase